MKKLGYFFKIIDNLDASIKKDIKNMLPFSFYIHFGKKNKNIDLKITKLLNNVNKKISENFGNSISYILAELADNIEQHSNHNDAFIIFKYNAKNKNIGFIVFDNGLGIPGVFRKNSFKFSNDNEAIKMALSGKTTKKEDITRGFGLSTTKQIISALNGKMNIVSGKGRVTIKKSNIKSFLFRTKLTGTLIYITIKEPDKYLNIYPYLQ